MWPTERKNCMGRRAFRNWCRRSGISPREVFSRGPINSVRGGKVTLALGNGQTITARLDGKMDLQQGSSMFFQVRANDGQTIAIRPYTELGNVSNPILLNALSAAQVPATDRTLVMVDTMMQEQMSIGRQSILDMAKLVGANPDANVQTIVQMTKLGLPVTEEMAAQFENYLSDRQALVGEMDLAAGHMMELLSDEALSPETAFSLYGKMLDIFMPGEEAADAGVTAAAGQESSASRGRRRSNGGSSGTGKCSHGVRSRGGRAHGGGTREPQRHRQ